MQKSFSFFVRIFLFPLFLFFLFSNPLQAAELSFAWTPNSDANLAGYKIYYGTAPRAYTMSIDVGNPTIADDKVTCTLTVFPAETTLYYFAATAYDVDGLESDYSDEVAVDISAEVNDTEAVFLFLTDGFPQEDISAVEETALLKAWQDQKISRDLYQAFNEIWPSRIYENLLSDARYHMDFLHILLGKFGIPVPQDIPGLFTDQEAQNLFDLLLDAGNVSAVEAFGQGAAIEDMIIDNLQIVLTQTDNLEIRLIYQNLLKSARNHLRLFANELSRAGIDYNPQYVSYDDFAAIIAAPVETGIYDGNGNTIFENGEWLVTASLNGLNQVDLSWENPAPFIDAANLGEPANEMVFRIMRSTNGGAYTFLADASFDATGYSDTSVVDGNIYQYRVFAVNVHVADLIGVFYGGKWYLDSNANNTWDGQTVDTQFSFGLTTDIAITGDWNGDGITEIGVYRTGKWYLDMNDNGIWDGTATDRIYTFGLATDIAITGDWNGDGITEIGVYRSGKWYLDMNGNGIWDGTATDRIYTFGLATDIAITGDWNGDGIAEIGVYRNGKWYLDMNGNGTWDGTPTDRIYSYGLSTDIAIAGDWNADGITEIGVYRNGKWYLDMNGNGAWDGTPTDRIYSFGQTGDVPIVRKR